jgi:hypothetical protein
LKIWKLCGINVRKQKTEAIMKTALTASVAMENYVKDFSMFCYDVIKLLLLFVNVAVFRSSTRVYPKVSGLVAWSENCKWYSSLPLGAVVFQIEIVSDTWYTYFENVYLSMHCLLTSRNWV